MPRNQAEELYAGCRWTESRFKTFVRTLLRSGFVRWPPRADALTRARRPAQGRSARTKWEYKCAICGDWFLGKEVEVDHKRGLCDVTQTADYVARLFCESDGLQVVCKPCHKAKTQAERNRNANSQAQGR